MTSSEVTFPRGRGGDDRENGVKRKRPIDHPQPDSLFGRDKTRLEETKKKKKVASGKKKDTEDLEMEEEVIIERIALTKLPPDVVIIGMITRITDYEITMSTPGGIIVSVPLFNISSQYSKIVEDFVNGSGQSNTHPVKPQAMFKIGQCLPVKIMEQEEREKRSGEATQPFDKIIGSISPNDVNEDVVVSNLKSFATDVVISAAVESVEDHGYIMDFGFGDKIKGFLLLDSSPASDVKGKTRLPVGSVFLVAGMSLKGRVLTVSAKASDMENKVITGDDALLTIRTLMPGTRVKCMIMNVKENGLIVVAGNEITGYVHKDYLRSEWDPPKDNYSIGETVTATVLYVHPQARQVVCSLRLVSFDSEAIIRSSKIMADKYKPGKLVKNAVVVNIEEKSKTIILKSKKGTVKMIASKKQLKDTALIEDNIKSDFPVGSTHDARVLSVNYFDFCVRVSLKPSHVKSDSGIELDSLHVGDIVTGKVIKLTEKGLMLSLGYQLQCFVNNLYLVDSTSVKHYEKLFPLDKEIKVRILKIKTSDGSDRPLIFATCKKSLLNLKPGMIINDWTKTKPGFVSTGVVVMTYPRGLLLEFLNGVRGFLPSQLLQDYGDIQSSFVPGQLLKCKVMSVDVSEEKMTLCLASQDNPEEIMKQGINARKKDMKTKRENEQNERVAAKKKFLGSIVNAKVGKFTQEGLLVDMFEDGSEDDTKITAIVPYTHLSDKPSVCKKDFQKKHPEGSDVLVRIFTTSKNGSVFATMKETLLSPKIKVMTRSHPLPAGNKVVGVVCKTWNGGRLVEFVGGAKGLIPKTELNKSLIGLMKHEYKNLCNGQLVACEVTSASPGKVILSLISLKNQLATDSGEPVEVMNDEEMDEGSDDENEKQQKEMSKTERIDLIKELKSVSKPRTRTTSNTSNLSLDSLPSQPILPFVLDVNPSKITFDDDEEVDDTEAPSEDEEEITPDDENNTSFDEEAKKRPSSKESLEKKKLSPFEQSRLKEASIREKEAALADRDRSQDKSLEELERDVVSHPNSSYHWLQLMSYLLDQKDVSSCRSVAEKALNTISFREEAEKFNVWVALINLEHMHGTKESLKGVIDRALSAMDQKRIYTHITKMYHESGKDGEARATFDMMLKKFREDKDVWIEYGQFQYMSGRFDAARKLLQRSFDCLSKRDHLDVICKFAQLEFKFGDEEKGKNLFESVIVNFPSRIAVWLIYLSMLIKYTMNHARNKQDSETKKDKEDSDKKGRKETKTSVDQDKRMEKEDAIESIRSIFERGLISLTGDKKKGSLLKKYLEFEQLHGNESTVARINDKLYSLQMRSSIPE